MEITTLIQYIKIVIAVTLISIILYVVYSTYQISKYKDNQPKTGADYLIILGAKVNGTRPSLSLQYRIETAASYLEKSPTTKVIVSGGQGPGEDITEAEAMKQELESMGIASERIIMENKSTSTYENLSYSREFISSRTSRIVVVTNDYHLYRAVSIGKKYGFKLEPLPAKTPKISIFKSYTREYAALLKFHLLSLTNKL